MYCSTPNICVCGVAPTTGFSCGGGIQSCDGRFYLGLSCSDGNLYLGWVGGAILWQTGVTGFPNSFLNLGADGQLYTGNSCATGCGVSWATGTNGNPGAFLVLQNDGNLVVFSPGWTPLWQSGTGGH
jgi:hypothetical protein